MKGNRQRRDEAAPLDSNSDRHIPKSIARLQSRVLARDAEHLCRHPGAASYERPYVPGEAWPIPASWLADAVTVRVQLIAGGAQRLREFLDADGQPVRVGGGGHDRDHA